MRVVLCRLLAFLLLAPVGLAYAGTVKYGPPMAPDASNSSNPTAINNLLKAGGAIPSGQTLTGPDAGTWANGGINGSNIGATTAGTGAFSTLSASSTVSGSGFSSYLASPPAIGGSAAAAGSFTTLSASSTVSGTGFSTYLASPPAIGGSAAAAGTFTNVTNTGFHAITGTTLPTQGAGTLGIGGEISAHPVMGANGEGDVYLLNATAGLTLIGKGSTSDITIQNSAGTSVISIPTNTTTATMAGAVTMAGLASSSAATTGTVCWTTATGNLTVDTTAACLASSRRFKDEIEPLELDKSLHEVLDLKPVSFRYKPEMKIPGGQIGLIAEDVAEIEPRLVRYDGKGTPMAVKYQEAVALAIAAIKAQQKEIDALRAEIAKR